MNEEDLEFILDFPECFEPQILKLVKARMNAMSLPKDDEEETGFKPTAKSLLCSTLIELGYNYEFDDDGDIYIEYQGERFFVPIDTDDESLIAVFKRNWLTVAVDDYNAVVRLYQAINYANRNGEITVTYSMSEDKREIEVNFNTVFLFGSFIPYLNEYLDFRLAFFFDVRKAIVDKMTEIYEIENAHAMPN